MARVRFAPLRWPSEVHASEPTDGAAYAADTPPFGPLATHL